MGGFEGGDEGGFWDIDNLEYTPSQGKDKNENRDISYIKTESGYSIKAHARVNIFYKILACKDGIHLRNSRLMRVDDLYDSISFVPCKCEKFSIEGCDEIELQNNSIYKAYQALSVFTNDLEITDFFEEHKVVLTKKIPLNSGLGGSASDAGAFMRLVKEVCNLMISTQELVNIGKEIDSEMPFFIYNYPCANVSSYGDIVEVFEEELLTFKIYTHTIDYDLKGIYNEVNKHVLEQKSESDCDLMNLDSRSILKKYSDSLVLNDFYKVIFHLYPELEKELTHSYFSNGSTFFDIV